MSQQEGAQEIDEQPELLPPEKDSEPELVPARAVRAPAADLERSGSLPALATMSEAEFEETLRGMQQTRARLRRIHKEVMQEDVDYGVIPGTDKPTLLKPGAELLFKMNRCVPQFTRQRTTGDGVTTPSIVWDSTCYAIDQGGQVVGEGAGSCNSWEKKYRWRKGDRVCPDCGAMAIRRSQYGNRGWYCWEKRDGCGAKFDPGDVRVTEQVTGQVENPDPYDVDNTLKKMADKRAQVAAALNLQAASGSFTQDAELSDDDGPAPANENGSGSGTAPASTGTIDKGKQALLRGKAKRRASHLGLTESDAGDTLLRSVLSEGGIDDVADVPMSSLNVVLESIDGYELPQ